jgi:hypothetical protein
MRGYFVFLLIGLAGIAGGARAQVESPLPSNMQTESLAPLPRAVSAVAVPVPASATVAVSETAPADPFVVKNVVVTLSDTTGFARDAALEKAARQALPQALAALPMAPAKAASTAKSVGSVMNFVGSYRIVKEAIVPTYSLTVDLTFDAAMLRKNFGGKVTPVAVVTSTVVVSGSAVEVSATPVVVRNWIVKVAQTDPAVLDKLVSTLNASPATHAVYRLLTSAGAELAVQTPLDAAALGQIAGSDAQLTPLDGGVPAAAGGATP